MVNIKMRKLLHILILILLFSCSQTKKQNEKNAKDISESGQLENQILKVDTVDLEKYSHLLTEWLEYYKENPIKMTDFTLIIQDSLPDFLTHVDTFDLSIDVNEPFFKYSPNMLIALDLTSYNFTFEKNENNEIVNLGSEPDSEVSIMDLKNNIWKRLLFVGPDYIVEDGFWINDNQLLIVGQSDENGEGDFNPVIWFIDLNKNIEQYFENKKITNSNCDYLEKIKYKSINLTKN